MTAPLVRGARGKQLLMVMEGTARPTGNNLIADPTKEQEFPGVIGVSYWEMWRKALFSAIVGSHTINAMFSQIVHCLRKKLGHVFVDTCKALGAGLET